MVAYVNNLQTLGWLLEEAWRIVRQVASRLKLLGIQEAARKRRLADGPWAGGIYQTDQGKITKTVSQLKWEKGKAQLEEVWIHKEQQKDMSYKRLEQVRGFLCPLSMVFEVITPYLKEFHLILARHLPQRDDQGWKFTDTKFVGHIEGKVEDGVYSR